MLKVVEIEVFYGDLQALRGVSLEVHQGEIVGIIGSNGAGKSTTLMTISGVLRPKRGEIRFGEEPIHHYHSSKVVSLGVVQIPEGRQLFPTMTVLENLELGALNPKARRFKQDNLKRIYALFPRLEERLAQTAGTLSGGEQQMLAIGRGLMSNPRILMLDEPSLGLSPMLVNSIFEIIRQINGDGITILLVEQNVHHSLKIAQRAYVLENGEITMQGPAGDLLQDQHVCRAYLGL